MEHTGRRPQRALQRSRLRMGEGCQYASHWQVLDSVGARIGGHACRLAIVAEGHTSDAINTAANMDGNRYDLNDYRVM